MFQCHNHQYSTVAHHMILPKSTYPNPTYNVQDIKTMQISCLVLAACPCLHLATVPASRPSELCGYCLAFGETKLQNSNTNRSTGWNQQLPEQPRFSRSKVTVSDVKIFVSVSVVQRRCDELKAPKSCFFTS